MSNNKMKVPPGRTEAVLLQIDAVLLQIDAVRQRKQAHEERVRVARLALEAMPTTLAYQLAIYRECGAPWFVAPTNDEATVRRRVEWSRSTARQHRVPYETIEAVFADLRTPF
jgi:hypothetical protein